MWWFLPVLSVALPVELRPDLKPATSDYMISFGVFILVAIMPHYIAGKILAGEKANILKGVLAAVLQILLGFVFLGVAIFAFTLCGASLTSLPWLSGAATIVLLGVLMAGIYSFGVAKGIAYNLATALAMFCIIKVLVIFFDPLPLKKVTAALTTRIIANQFQKFEEVAKTRNPEITAEKRAAFFASVTEAQMAAVKKYPALGVAFSPFNKRFIEIHARMKVEQPAKMLTTDWPMEIADLVAAEPDMK